LRYKAITGLDDDQVAHLVDLVTKVMPWDPRRVLDPLRAVVMTLQYLRHNTAQVVLAFHYQVDQSAVSRLIRRVAPILSQGLEDFDLDTDLPATALLVDGTLIPTGNRAGRPELYSGRRHRSGMNVQVVADLGGRVITTSYPVSGSISDLEAFRAWGLADRLDTPDTVADKGYQGTNMITPTKKPKNREPDPDRLAANKVLSGIRSAVERAIAHLKNWKILGTGYRGRLSELPALVRTIIRLERFRTCW
jgi:hypothetical protein